MSESDDAEDPALDSDDNFDFDLDGDVKDKKKKKKKKKKAKKKKKKEKKPKIVWWEEYWDEDNVLKWKHRQTDEIVLECPKEIYHLYWIEAKDEDDAKEQREADALIIKGIQRDRKFLMQSAKYQKTKIEFMKQHGAQDNCPELLLQKEELLRSKREK